MPKYFFEAKTPSGEERIGFREAVDIKDLISQLKKEGLTLIRVEMVEKKKPSFTFFSFSVPLVDKMFFTRNLKIMISAGVPLTKAILTLAEQVKNKKFRQILLEIQEKVTRGEKFSDALSFYPEVFSEIYQNMIKVGEESGTLENSLEVLATQMEREKEIKDRIKSALIYPTVVVVLMIVIGFLLLTFVVPKLTETFKELEVELPRMTKITIALGEFFSKNFSVLILIFGGIFFFIVQFLKTRFGKYFFHSLLLNLPIISELIKKSNCALFSRTLSSLISAGVSLPKSLEITAKTLNNVFFQDALIESAEKIKKGKKLSQILVNYKKFIPFTLISMIEIGEETGELSMTLSKLAEFYEAEVETTTRNLSSLIEPLLLIVVGIVVGFFVISMIQPIYSTLQFIQ